jgi:hypothetical protein
MANADIQITISGGEMAGEQMRFDPGSALQASVQIIGQENLKYRSIRVTLGWHTEGYGNRDHDDAAVSILDQEGMLQPGSSFYRQMSFNMPNEPWSYAGHYINIIWEAKATIDIAMGKDIEAVQRFILAPREAQSPLALEQSR